MRTAWKRMGLLWLPQGPPYLSASCCAEQLARVQLKYQPHSARLRISHETAWGCPGTPRGHQDPPGEKGLAPQGSKRHEQTWGLHARVPAEHPEHWSSSERWPRSTEGKIRTSEMWDFLMLDYDTLLRNLKRIKRPPNWDDVGEERNSGDWIAGPLPPVSSLKKPKLCAQSYAPNFSTF